MFRTDPSISPPIWQQNGLQSWSEVGLSSKNSFFLAATMEVVEGEKLLRYRLISSVWDVLVLARAAREKTELVGLSILLAGRSDSLEPYSIAHIRQIWQSHGKEITSNCFYPKEPH